MREIDITLKSKCKNPLIYYSESKMVNHSPASLLPIMFFREKKKQYTNNFLD